MVEVQNININDLEKKDGKFLNEIYLSPNKQINSKNLASESELHRILLHLDKKENAEPLKNKSGYTVIPSYFTLEVGKNVERYNTLINKKGELVITNMRYVLNENGEKVLDENDHYKVEVADTNTYISTFCGAGHSRTQKNLFVKKDVIERLNEILLCGIPKNLMYEKPHKWNAYYSLVTTDSTPLKKTPNIVVIKDYKKKITADVDYVDVSGKGENKKYIFNGHGQEKIEINPFDGAGLVTPECALKWAKELNCKSRSGTFYVPSCFQFRMLPAFKGELMVFDLKKFAKERKVSKIVDLGGKEWDIFKDKIDVVITESQFKFWKQYLGKDNKFDYWLWRKNFDQECHGYQRTFNIVSYGKHPDDLRKTTMLSYQPEQTLDFTNEEIQELSKAGIGLYKKVSSDINEFLKYRSLISVLDETGEEVINSDEYIPPYYVALLNNKELYYDDYVRSKIENDINKLKKNVLCGKLFVNGNYQVFIPDLYGLAEWTFHDELGEEPKGLLFGKYDIYSNWWNERCKKEVDIIRNPAVGMEHRICSLKNNHELKKWYKYQSTGIVTSMYGDLALVLGGADFDGDTVCTLCDAKFIDAVKRELAMGHGRLVFKRFTDKVLLESESTEKKVIKITDVAEIMRINQISFGNSIGSVIDRVTDLWSMIKVDEEKIRGYIATGVIVGSETIDFAKTGENADFPADIKEFLKGKRRGYWMRYLPKHEKAGIGEKKAIKLAKKLEKSDEEIDKLRKFEDYDCTMNKLCHYAEAKIAEIDSQNAADILFENKKFDYRKYLLRSNPPINREIYRKIQVLQKQYQELSNKYRQECSKSKTQQREAKNMFKWFYENSRVELLTIEPDVNKLIDILVKIFYSNSSNSAEFLKLEKDVLWNVFPQELIARCSENEIVTEIDFEKLEKQYQKNVELVKKRKNENMSKKKVLINFIDKNKQLQERDVFITVEDRKYINSLVDKAYKDRKISRADNVIKVKRILAILLFLSRKCENTEKASPQYIKKYNNVSDELTDIAIEKLTGVSRKYVNTTIALLDKLGAVETKIFNGGIKIKVLDKHLAGKCWIETNDYNKAGTMIRSYFRK